MKKKISLFRCVYEKRKRVQAGENGFTLIETLTVLAIFSILSATLIPMMSGFIEDAKKKAYVSEAYLVKAAAQAYVIEHNADGALDEIVMYEEIFQYEVSDPANALYDMLKGGVTKGAVIKGLNYDKATSKVKELEYCVKKYDIEIMSDTEVKVRDRD